MRNRLVLAGVVAILIVSVVLFGRGVIDHLRMLWYQHACLTYESVPGEAAYDETGRAKLAAPLVPQCWTNFYTAYSPPGFRSTGTVFLHSLRTTTGGAERLVALDILGRRPGGITLQSRVFRPGSLFDKPTELTALMMVGFFSRDGKDIPPATVYLGVTDPKNPSHFTFDVSSPAGRSTINGWLGDDDTLLLE